MKKNSKIILSLFLSVFMMIAIVGCDKKEDVNVLKKEVSFIAPNGVPATAISKMIKENIQVDDNYNINYSIENTADTLATAVMKGEPDIAIVPSNLALQAYNKGLGYKLVGTTGLGALYLVSAEGDISFEDLNGKEVYNIGSGLTPDIVFKALLKESNIENVTLSYVGGPTELAPAILGGKAKYAVVPEPALTTILSKNSNIKVIASLNDLWKEKFNSETGFPQSSLIVKEELINENKDFMKKLTEEILSSTNWVNENNNDAAKYSIDNGSQVEEAILEKSIKNSSIAFVKAKDNKEDYINYYKVLESENAKSIGEKLPDENFFYEG
ncbi:ABC transporter substrate-binding protein [Clostridium sp. Sa3CUN1]|uniref:ABC transporter substrate-binding protein n=1 Tax=Clostridium gallinarum TaxID=2762246 RepID=A0ABR8Q034_9CLOT|nr:MqnA/MqnD/SBP family protein [Clostridium gallinarum]MBD7913719.1 ABC transporter substrate-binding protein [Clostridium gallinarum]